MTQQKLESIPTDSMRIEGSINPDGTLVLHAALFQKDGWQYWHHLPFSDFSDTCTTIDELVNIIGDTIQAIAK